MIDRPRRAVRLHVSGVVQGVGFRPFVHRLAARHGVVGWVRNTSGDVEIAAEGEATTLPEFIGALRTEAPPLARIDRLDVEDVFASDLSEFTILESSVSSARGLVAPDIALCAECEHELLDPSDRRYRYPFITCTNCGPRYSVIDATPYDRSRTSMRAFAQCPACLAEYESIGNRRYHSETNSCPVCGPRLVYVDRDGAAVDGDPIATAAQRLIAGEIVAIRGVGGFHLAADATNESAVRRLRLRKRRDAKPLAVMVRSIEAARQIAVISAPEQRWLIGAERPIVIVNERSDTPVVAAVSECLGTIGVVLAYTPMHVLLLDAVERPLVMTSGNPSGQPLAASLAEARESLGDIADGYLTHDREIVARVDDSVMRVARDIPIVMRRARGFAPLPLTLPIATPEPLVAVGPHLKNTLTIAAGASAFVSPHVGDLETIETEEHWRRTFDSLRRLFGIEPRVVVRDLHPQYLSTRIADRLPFPIEHVIGVQHHHAHIAAVAAEHGVTDPVIGVAFDGAGYGDDGHTWGAEILITDLVSHRRVAHVRYAPLPGGDRAARSPWRTLIGYESLIGEREFQNAVTTVGWPALAAVRRQLAAKVNSPLASSMGRLFDAAAAVLGVCLESRFEGEAAMRLESIAGARPGRVLPFDLAEDGELLVLEPISLLLALRDERLRGRDVADLAADFHETVAVQTASLVSRIAERERLRTVALGGGVFQNARLFTRLHDLLRESRLRVLVPRLLSPNDGAVSYGQAVVAAARLELAGEFVS